MAVGSGVGSGVAVGFGVGSFVTSGLGVGCGVGVGVTEGSGVGVGATLGLGVGGSGVCVGVGVGVGSGVGVGVGSGVGLGVGGGGAGTNTETVSEIGEYTLSVSLSALTQNVYVWSTPPVITKTLLAMPILVSVDAAPHPFDSPAVQNTPYRSTSVSLASEAFHVK